MGLSYRDWVLVQERGKDLLREAEHAWLVRLATSSPPSRNRRWSEKVATGIATLARKWRRIFRRSRTTPPVPCCEDFEPASSSPAESGSSDGTSTPVPRLMNWCARPEFAPCHG